MTSKTLWPRCEKMRLTLPYRSHDTSSSAFVAKLDVASVKSRGVVDRFWNFCGTLSGWGIVAGSLINEDIKHLVYTRLTLTWMMDGITLVLHHHCGLGNELSFASPGAAWQSTRDFARRTPHALMVAAVVNRIRRMLLRRLF